ncbi:MAG TPA: multicopper oxidase domain-containing protein [Vicinamibacterales bacterium]|nr:multicopper oxidase domain-containing protein [Vicinamibacterales bacterium]
MRRRNYVARFHIAMLTLAGLLMAGTASAAVDGLSGSSFTLTARADRISTPEGNSIYIWGFDAGGGRAQYPGPTLILEQGVPVTITVVNALPASAGQRVSLALPGQSGVTASCAAQPCVQGPITMEAGVNGQVTYTFTPSRPGTFLYNSASRPDLQVEMGLTGAIVVRPSGFSAAAPNAYGSAASGYDQEYLFFLSEMDSDFHDIVELQGVAAADQSRRLANYFPNYWFINGRNAPDTMADAGIPRLPTQPYNSLPRTHPGDRLLMRVVGGGHDMHPFHHHGNHARIIAVDAVPLETAGATTPFDLSREVFTIQSLPGQTVDAIFRWTGKDIGWDVYGDAALHAATFAGITPPSCDASVVLDAEGLDPRTREYCADHGKGLPVTLPEQFSLTFGGFWSGSPFLGSLELLPPGQGGLNPNAGYTYMWHSHTEKEITNYDLFPGGLMTMLVIEPLQVPIP